MSEHGKGLLAGLGANAGGMLASAYTGTHGWGGMRPSTGRVIGGLADQALGTGHAFSQAGDAVDVVQDVKSLGAVRGGLAGYGAYALGDAAGQAGAHLTGERTMEDVAEDNDRQRHQGALQNVGENLASPGRAAVQLGADWRGMAKDVQGAWDSSAKTRQMQQDLDTKRLIRRQQDRSNAIRDSLRERGLVK